MDAQVNTLNIRYSPRQFCKHVRIVRINPHADSVMVINWDYPAIKHPRIYVDYGRKKVRFFAQVNANGAGSMWAVLGRSNIADDLPTAISFFEASITEILAVL